MRKTLLLITLAYLACLPAAAQKPIPGPYCNLLSAAGQSRASEFMAFNDELRQALAKQHISALTLLVHFPFRVNTNNGAYFIQDAGEFRAEFQKLFPPGVRNQIIHQNPSTISCNIEGIRLGQSPIWGLLVNHWQFGYAIDTINLDVPPPLRERLPNRVRLSHPKIPHPHRLKKRRRLQISCMERGPIRREFP